MIPGGKRLRALAQWTDLRGREPGFLAFVMHRITGLGLAVYLLAHLGILSLLAQGPQAWDAFVAIAKSPLFLFLDLLLILGLLVHGLNGVRLSLAGLGIGVSVQQRMFWVLLAVAVILTAVAGVRIFWPG